MMKENISFPDLGKDIVIVHHSRHGLRLIGRMLQMVEAFHSVHFHEERQIQRTAHTENILTLDMEFFFQDL